MKKLKRSAHWGWLYTIFALMLALFYMESRLELSPSGRVLAQFGVLAVVYILTNMWINANLPFDSWS